MNNHVSNANDLYGKLRESYVKLYQGLDFEYDSKESKQREIHFVYKEFILLEIRVQIVYYIK